MQTISIIMFAVIAGGVLWWLNQVLGPRVRARQQYLADHPEEAAELRARSYEGYVESRRPTLTRAVLTGPVIAFFWRKKTRNRIKLG